MRKGNKQIYYSLKRNVNKQHVNRKSFANRADCVVIDARDKPFGRVCSEIAKTLMGKDNPYYELNKFNGTPVILQNYQHAILTGNKASDKMRFWYTGYPGGIKSAKLSDLMANKHTYAYCKAVKNMLPKNRLYAKAVKHCIIFE